MVDDCRMSHRETVDCQAEQIRRGERLVGAHMAARFALEVSAEQQNHSSIDRAGGTEPGGGADGERGFRRRAARLRGPSDKRRGDQQSCRQRSGLHLSFNSSFLCGRAQGERLLTIIRPHGRIVRKIPRAHCPWSRQLRAGALAKSLGGA